MDFKQYFLYQTDYQHWANNALFNALDRLDQEARTSPQKMPFETLHNSVDHLAYFYVKWFARLKGEQQAPTYTGTVHPDWRELKNDMRQSIRALQRWLEHQPHEFFDQPLRYRRTLSQAENAIWVRDALTHVFTFAAMERGQIAAIAGTLGAPLPSMAYYTYRREMGEHLENMRKIEPDTKEI